MRGSYVVCRMPHVVLTATLMLWSAPSLASCISTCRAARGCEYDYSSLSCKLAGDDCLFKCDTEAPSTKNYGAISYSRESEFSGTSHGFSNRASAEARAQTECAIGGRDCKVIVWFWNSCAAIAVGGDVVAWGRDPSLRVAKASALNECRNSDGAGCRIEDLACSP